MTSENGIRWDRRFSNFIKALSKLSEAVNLVKINFTEHDDSFGAGSDGNILEEVVKEGLIQRFEYTFELAWNTMKDYAMFQGIAEINYAFASNLIINGECWMDMIKNSVKTSHLYNEETARAIYQKIIDTYYQEFIAFRDVMKISIVVSRNDFLIKNNVRIKRHRHLENSPDFF